jgi:hypothetical protein
MRATFRPLRKELWQGEFTPARERRSRYTFKAPWSDTLSLLNTELIKLGAHEVVIEADFRESDIRLDGLPRANARVPEFPGVRVAFESKHGPLVYQTDTCASWQHNVRSIALGLEALRAVDRYGITSRAEQYTGFKAIGSGPDTTGITAEDARALLVAWAGREDERWPLMPDDQKKLVRQARSNAHPDRHGGDHTHWNLVEGAIRFLRATGALA